MARTATATLAGRSLGCAQRVGDDRPQRPRATAAVRAAAEALIDLGRGARAARPRVETGAHIVVGEDVAGADDHCVSGGGLSQAITPRRYSGNRIQSGASPCNRAIFILDFFKRRGANLQPASVPAVDAASPGGQRA